MTLKALRINAGLTQSEVGERIGVSAVTIGKWEKGKTYPKIPQVFALADVYHCSIDDIYLPIVST